MCKISKAIAEASVLLPHGICDVQGTSIGYKGNYIRITEQGKKLLIEGKVTLLTPSQEENNNIDEKEVINLHEVWTAQEFAEQLATYAYSKHPMLRDSIDQFKNFKPAETCKFGLFELEESATYLWLETLEIYLKHKSKKEKAKFLGEKPLIFGKHLKAYTNFSYVKKIGVSHGSLACKIIPCENQELVLELGYLTSNNFEHVGKTIKANKKTVLQSLAWYCYDIGASRATLLDVFSCMPTSELPIDIFENIQQEISEELTLAIFIALKQDWSLIFNIKNVGTAA